MRARVNGDLGSFLIYSGFVSAMTPQEREDAALDSLLERAAQVGPGREESYGPHPDQIIEWYAPRTSGGSPIVFVHGGFFRPTIDRAHARLAAAILADQLARPVVLAEYRRVSGDPDLSVTDIHAISDLLEGLGEEPAAWVGHSAGGTLVLQRAFDQVRPAVPVVALAPVVDLTSGLTETLGEGAIMDWLGARTAAKRGRYAHLDPVRLLAEVPERLGQVRCVHGAEDLTVPVAQSTGSGLAVDVIAGAHHYDLIDPAAAAWTEVVVAVRSAVSGEGQGS